MKKIVFIIIAISLSTLLQAQQSLTKSQQEVQQTVTQMFDALSNRDTVGLKACSTTDIALFENGAIWNFDTLIKKAITLNQSKDFNRSNKIDFINTTVDKNIAWATYHLHSEITREAKQSTVQWLETVVLVKKKSKWKITVLHSTLIKRT